MKKLFIAFCISLLLLNVASAVVVNSVVSDPIAPGEESRIELEVRNILSEDVEEVSLSFDFTNTPFIPIGSSEESVDEIEEGDEEEYIFRIKADNDIVPGNYEIPYTLRYLLSGEQRSRQGTIGVQVIANPDLTFSITANNPVMGQQGEITIRMINRGFYDARFVSVKILPEDFTLLSNAEVYVGEIESDDFETASFDVLFTEADPTIHAIVTYRDFENADQLENVEIPLKVYSRERAIELGIVQQSYTSIYVGLAILVVILIILWRTLKKRRRLKKSVRKETE